LTGLVRSVVAFVSVGFEQISTAVRQDNGAIVGTERRRTQQTLLLEVPLGLASVVAAVVEITFGDNPEGADGGEHPAFGAVDVVYAIPVSHWPTLTATRQVEVSREHVAWVTIGFMIEFATPTAAAAVSVAEVVAIAVI
jgi:hypothetical protein